MEELNAITRKEKFLAKAAGQDVETPEPITREEMFLSKIAGGSSGGGGLPVVVLTTPIVKGTEATLSAEESAALSAAFASNTSVVIHLNVEGVDIVLPFVRYSIHDAVAAFLGYINLSALGGEVLSFFAFDNGVGEWLFAVMSSSGGGSAPGGGIPVVELETVATKEGSILSEADAAKINELILAGNVPFAVKCVETYLPAALVLNGLALTEEGMVGGYFTCHHYLMGKFELFTLENITTEGANWVVTTSVDPD